ncbi:MAG TPA: protein kinase, partial [Spirillospora sp.]|nr:protein kinase [Spirillospora sp.]
MENLTGRSLGQYELRELLGAGGMGAVYRGYQRNLRRDVAVKVLYTSLSQQSEHEERFTREAHTAAALEHAHIVPVYDYGTERGLSYVVMRLLTGGSLAERIEYSNTTGRPLPSLSEVVRITSDLASALDYAHAQGVIHRDIKDKNIMFDNQGTVFLVDFGIAKLLGTVSGLTNTGATVGTPWYMAPEQWRGDPITPAVDQYALAVTVYTMLTGKMPFEAETPYQLMHKHLNELPIPLDNWREDLPPAINDVLQRALEKEPDARYLTVMEFAQEFASAVNRLPASTGNTGFFTTPLPAKKAVLPLIASAAGSSTDPQAVAQAPAQPRSLPLPLWATAAIIAVALLIGVGVGVALLRPGQPATDPPASEAPAVAAEAITDTPEPTTVPASPTEAVVIVPTEPPTDTPPPTATATNTEQPTLTATASETATPTATVTETPTATLTETATLAPATETPAAEVQVAVVTDTAAPSVTPLPTS